MPVLRIKRDRLTLDGARMNFKFYRTPQQQEKEMTKQVLMLFLCAASLFADSLSVEQVIVDSVVTEVTLPPPSVDPVFEEPPATPPEQPALPVAETTAPVVEKEPVIDTPVIVDEPLKVTKKVVVIPVNGTVNSALSAYLNRVIRQYRGSSDCILVFEMDTYGGEVDAAFSIVDTILNIGDIETIAYVKTKAISAGALIALSCDKLIMKKSTTIGDVAPLMMSNDGPKMLGEKFQSPIRAKFRTLAKRNGYHENLTDAMVTEGKQIFRITFPDTVLYVDSTELAELDPKVKSQITDTKTVVKKGELLTMDDAEAYEFGFSKGSVESIDDMLKVLNLSGSTVIRSERSWSEAFVALIAKIAPILMMIGFAALYIEIRTPGFGAPGIIGVICLSLVFLSQYVVGLADYTELLLMAIGILLLAIEVFVLPGFGIAGIAGILFLFVAMVLSLQGFVLPKPEFPWQKQLLIKNLMFATSSMVGAIILIVLFFRYLFPRLGMLVNGPYLHASLKDAHVDTNTEWVVHVGDRGVATTTLRPAGKVEIHGILYDVVAESMFIEQGQGVTVTEVSGNRIVVSKENVNVQ